MSALANLTNAVATLQTAVDLLQNRSQNQVSDAQLQSLADSVNAQVAIINTILPAPPTP